jgi:hypothetical protein
MELQDMISEYMTNSEDIIRGLEKQAEEYRMRLSKAERTPAPTMITKEAAAEAAAALVGKGWMSASDLNHKIDRLRADPLGVITGLVKTAAAAGPIIVGEPANKGVSNEPTKERGEADTALLTRLGLL